MATTDDSHHSNLSVPATSVQSVTFRSHTVGVGMTAEHYDLVKSRVREDLHESRTSSIWLALAFATASVVVALLVAITSTGMTAATKGKYEVAAWAGALFTVTFAIVHLLTWKGASRRADVLIKDMDVHCFRVAVPERDESVVQSAVTPSPRLEILRATYGETGHAASGRNVTSLVRRLARDGSLECTVDNTTMGGDPRPGAPKTLVLWYREPGQSSVSRSSFAEGSVVRLPLP